MNLKYNIVFNESFNEKLKKEWETFERNSHSTIFQTYFLSKIWWKNYSRYNPKDKLLIVTIMENNKPIYLFPFYINFYFKLKILKFLGDKLFDYNGPIYSNYNQEEFKIIWNKVLSKLSGIDIIFFNKIPSSINNIKNPLYDFSKFYLNSNEIILKDNWDNFYGSIKSKIKADSRRQTKRLSILGNIEYVISNNTNDSLLITKKMIEQKIKRYEITGVYNIFDDLYVEKFYTDVAQSKNKNVHISSLKINNNIIATHFGYIHKNKFYYLMPSYNSDIWSKYSPGKLLLEFLIKESYKLKLNVFVFTNGLE